MEHHKCGCASLKQQKPKVPPLEGKPNNNNEHRHVLCGPTWVCMCVARHRTRDRKTVQTLAGEYLSTPILIPNIYPENLADYQSFVDPTPTQHY